MGEITGRLDLVARQGDEVVRRRGEPDELYKVLSADGTPCHGGTGAWSLPRDGEPGEWMPEIADPVPCERGYHLCRERDLVFWLGPAIWAADGRGARVDAGDKVVYAQARLLRRVETWTERAARLLAADCAERVLSIYERGYPADDRPREAIAATRAYARGEIDAAARAAAWDAVRAAAGVAARDVAWDAAKAAAGAAARAAAWDAAKVAAGDAARVAAGDAAWAAAGDAAWAAAWAAAGDAAGDAAWADERAWQTRRLMQYLRGEVTSA